MESLLAEHPSHAGRIGLRELARLSGYSYFTVSKVMNGHSGVAGKTRDAILELAHKHRYRPSAAARSILRNKTFQVGVLLRNAPDKPFHNPSSLETIVGLNNTLAREGYLLSLIRIGDIVEDFHRESRAFQEHALDGVVISGNVPWPAVETAQRTMPCCLYMDCNVWSSHSCIQQDEYYAGYMVGEHLVQQGYRRIVWVGPDPKHYGHYSGIRRFAGVQAAAMGSGVELKAFYRTMEQKLYSHQMIPGDFVSQHCRSDTAMIGYGVGDAMEWAMIAMQMGWVAPRDYGLASCEETQAFSEHWPDLTRVSFSRLTIGQQAGEMFLQLLKTPDAPPLSRIFHGKLIVGRTTRRVLSAGTD